jgi:hypothetical protein
VNLDYKNTTVSLRREAQRLELTRERLAAELADVEKRIQGLTAAIRALTSVSEGTDLEVPLDVVEKAGKFDITASVREVLRTTADWLLVPEIRDALVAKGWRADDYDNPLAVIHTILKRLVKAGELMEERTQTGKKIFCHEPSVAARDEEKERRDVERAKAAHAQHLIESKVRRVLPKACRQILQGEPAGLSAPEIYKKLMERGIEIDRMRDPMTAIYGTLSMLRQSISVRTFKQMKEGKERNVYQLVRATEHIERAAKP